MRIYSPIAKRAAEREGVRSDILLAQAALESGWGNKAVGYNFFGVKGRGNKLQTSECSANFCADTRANFRVYKSAESAFVEQAQMLKRVYKSSLQKKSAAEQLRSIYAAGYATHPAAADRAVAVLSKIKENES